MKKIPALKDKYYLDSNFLPLRNHLFKKVAKEYPEIDTMKLCDIVEYILYSIQPTYDDLETEGLKTEHDFSDSKMRSDQKYIDKVIYNIEE